jgi:hypothetical protein
MLGFSLIPPPGFSISSPGVKTAKNHVTNTGYASSNLCEGIFPMPAPQGPNRRPPGKEAPKLFPEKNAGFGTTLGFPRSFSA